MNAVPPDKPPDEANPSKLDVIITGGNEGSTAESLLDAIDAVKCKELDNIL